MKVKFKNDCLIVTEISADLGKEICERLSLLTETCYNYKTCELVVYYTICSVASIIVTICNIKEEYDASMQR